MAAKTELASPPKHVLVSISLDSSGFPLGRCITNSMLNPNSVSFPVLTQYRLNGAMYGILGSYEAQCW